MLKITIPSFELLHDEELKLKLEEFDYLITIYKEKESTEVIREFENKLVIYGDNELIVNWFLHKDKIFEKADSTIEALHSLSQIE